MAALRASVPCWPVFRVLRLGIPLRWTGGRLLGWSIGGTDGNRVRAASRK
jgi:hypothetical protein